jgi:hypothetical protein
MYSWKIAALTLALCAATPTYAQTVTLVPIARFPTTTVSTTAFTINNKGMIAGSYVAATKTTEQTRGFYQLPSGSYQTVVVGGLNDGTEVRGINDNGDIVGTFHKDVPCAQNGFLYPVAAGLSPLGCQGFVRTANGPPQKLTDTAGMPMVAMVTGINNAGTYVGQYCVCSHSQMQGHAIAFYGAGGKIQAKMDFSSLHPSPDQAKARGINKSRAIVGTLTFLQADGTRSISGFLLRNNMVYVLNFPQTGAQTLPAAINDSGDITGSWNDVNKVSHGFALGADLTHWRSFDLPGEISNGGGTEVWGLNNAVQFLIDAKNDPAKYPVSFVVCPPMIHPALTGACTAKALATKGTIEITPLAVTGSAPIAQTCSRKRELIGPSCFARADLVPAN